jgi:hypothetical protein
VEHFPALLAIAFDDSAKLAAIIAKLALQYFGKFDRIAIVRFERLSADRQHWRVMGYANAKGLLRKGGL